MKIDLYQILNNLTWISPFLLISGTVIGSIYYKRLDSLHKVLLYYLISMVSLDILSRICGIIFQNNLIFIPILSLTELCTFSMAFYLLGFKYVKKLRYLLICGNIILFLLCLIELLWMFFYTTLPKYSKIVNACLLLFFSFLYFFNNIKDNRVICIKKYKFSSFIMLFFSLNFILYVPFDFLINDISIYKFYIWFFHLAITLLFYLYLIKEIWANGKIQNC